MSKELPRDSEDVIDARMITTSSYCASSACVGFREGIVPGTEEIVDHFNGKAVESLAFSTAAVRGFVEAVKAGNLQLAPVTA